MEWIDALRGETVGLDTAPLIYFIEQHPVRAAKLKPFFAAAERREFRVVTSLVTLLEVLVHPLRNGRDDLASEYRDILLRSPSLTALPVSEEIAEEAACLVRRQNARRYPVGYGEGRRCDLVFDQRRGVAFTAGHLAIGR